MRPIPFLCLPALCFSLHAAPIQWGEPQPITGKLDDFLTEGELVLSWCGGNSTVIIDELNRNIVFDPGSRLSNGLVGSVDPKSRPDRNYDLLLDQATTGNSTSSITFTDMAIGQRYKLQLWLADTRTSSANRTKTYDSGPGTPQVKLNTGTPSAQFVIGTFVADAETQQLRFVAGNGVAEQPQYNAIMIRAVDHPQPAIQQFTATLGTVTSNKGLLVTPGAEVTLNWNVARADKVNITGQGDVQATGTAKVTVQQTASLTLTATNADGPSAQTITLHVGAATEPPKLSEILAKPGRTSLEDEDGDREDWIELENPNPFALDLTGYALSDDDKAPQKWKFPAGATLPASGFLVVFASGKDRGSAASELHANFKLSDEAGGVVILTGPDGKIVSSFSPYPAQHDNVSWGRGNFAQIGFFGEATPGAPNVGVFAGKVLDTKFSKVRGYHDAPFDLAITTETPEAQIYYTTNGTVPGPSTSTLYQGPIHVERTMVIRAAGFREGWLPTNVDTSTFIFPDSVIKHSNMRTSVTQHATYGPQMRQAITDLPSIALSFQGTPDYPERPASVEMINADGTSAFQENCGMGLFGGYWTNFQKKNFRLYFRKEYGAPKLRYPGLFAGFERGRAVPDSFDGLDLRGGSHDMNERGFYMSSMYTDDTMADVGNLVPHGRWVHLYMNAVYWGVFHFRERWHAAMMASYLGGTKEDHSAINGNANVGGWAIGANYDGTNKAWVTIKNERRNYETLSQWLHVPNYIDFNLLYMSGDAENEFRCAGPSRVGPGYRFWFNDADGFLRPLTDKTSDQGPGSILSALRTQGHPDFKVLLADRIHRFFHGDGEMTAAKAVARLDERAKQLERPFLAEAARWGIRTPDSWRSAKDNALKTLLPKVATSNVPRFRSKGMYPATAAPAFSLPAGQVEVGTMCEITAGAELHYTTDGSDPRLPGGDVSPKAKTVAPVDGLATEHINIIANTYFRARAKNGAEWSAIQEIFYHLGTPIAPGQVVISELHYNPAGKEDSEFLELLNPTNQAANLRGCRFSKGINYYFPHNRDFPLAPGARLVLCASELGFTDKYGLKTQRDGGYLGSLNNDGETIALVTAANQEILTLTYGDRAPWPDAADDQGPSLVLTNPAAPNQAASWKAGLIGGTPGAAEGSSSFTGDPLADRDGDGLRALTEYAFGTSDAVADPAPVLVRLVTKNGAAHAEISFPKAVGADDVELSLESSSDLSQWSAGAFAEAAGDVRRAVWQTKAPVSGRLFARVKTRKK